MPDATTTRLIAQCRKIAAIFDKELPDTALGPAAHRAGGINPYYNRTTSGLYLEFYYGLPSKIWTPGGYWAMTGSTSFIAGQAERLAALVMRHLDAKLHLPMRQDRNGCYGPVFAIWAIDGELVDAPGDVIRFSKLGYHEMRAEWAELAEGWR